MVCSGVDNLLQVSLKQIVEQSYMRNASEYSGISDLMFTQMRVSQQV